MKISDLIQTKLNNLFKVGENSEKDSFAANCKTCKTQYFKKNDFCGKQNDFNWKRKKNLAN